MAPLCVLTIDRHASRQISAEVGKDDVRRNRDRVVQVERTSRTVECGISEDFCGVAIRLACDREFDFIKGVMRIVPHDNNVVFLLVQIDILHRIWI